LTLFPYTTLFRSFIVDGAKNGWVAIGSATPLSPFYIAKNRTQSNNQPQIVITDNQAIPRRIAVGTETNNYANPFIGSESPHHLLFNTNSSTKMILTSSGRLGIGVSYTDILSSSQLDVSGAITIRGEQLNLTHVQTQNVSGVYLHLPAVGDAGYGDFALLRQIGGVGNSGGTLFGNYHLALDLHNDEVAGQPNLNQQFSIRNIGSDGAGNDTIQTRVKIDGLGRVGINVAENNGDLVDRLTINGNVSASGNLTVRGSGTFNSGLNVVGNVTTTGASLGNTNLITGSIADARYTQLSAFYKNGESTFQYSSSSVWTNADMFLDLQSGVYIFDMQMYVTTSNAVPTNAALGVKTRFNHSNNPGNQSMTVQTEITRLASPKDLKYNTSLPISAMSTPNASHGSDVLDSRGILEVRNPGRFSIQVANNAFGVQNITIGKYSYIRVAKIA
jgi:hypothetical protein